MSGQLKIAQKWEDMAGYAYGALRQFPKSERFTIGAELRECLWKGFVLKADIAAYFPSIVHDRLLAILYRTIRDKGVFWLCRIIIEGCGHQGRGVPVGALTSQLFANIYMAQRLKSPEAVPFIDGVL